MWKCNEVFFLLFKLYFLLFPGDFLLLFLLIDSLILFICPLTHSLLWQARLLFGIDTRTDTHRGITTTSTIPEELNSGICSKVAVVKFVAKCSSPHCTRRQGQKEMGGGGGRQL